ncbi:GNAT family N-acetyltransferase [Sphaerisporangium sp. B11E5]|uniref:GNAT family N-acetyltransferase n=1 Tax=Sphaerisporangium sp. B11E5 TaxID=3153563 RepID=UPI00325DBCE2
MPPSAHRRPVSGTSPEPGRPSLEIRAWTCPARPCEAWQEELRAFRGRVIHDGGRRPRFKVGDGLFADPDRHDAHAYHILARNAAGGPLTGSVRLTPLGAATRGRVMALAGAEAGRLLAAGGYAPSDTGEGARLVVAEDARARGVGRLLVVAGTVLLEQLGLRLAVILAGTRDGQHEILRRMGFTEVSPTRYPLPEVEDEAVLMACTPADLPARDRQLAAELRPVVADLLRVTGREECSCART